MGCWRGKDDLGLLQGRKDIQRVSHNGFSLMVPCADILEAQQSLQSHPEPTFSFLSQNI